MWKKIRIRKHEVGLWFRHGDLRQLLSPGAHRIRPFLPGMGRDTLEVVSTLEPKFEHVLLKILVTSAAVADRLTIVDLRDDERALVWKDGRLGWILEPGLHAFWNENHTIKVELFNTEVFRFEHPKLESVMNHSDGRRIFDGVRVESHERIVLFRDGELVDQFGPGMYVFWKNAGKITWKSVDLREQVSDIAGQEIMTADKVTLRVNLVVTYRVIDTARAVLTVSDYEQTLYREAQLALREAVGTRPLDRLLADKDQVGAEIRNTLAPRVDEFGVVVRSVGLRDIILPGDRKVILNEVILAQKQAEANLIRRREETAAARSQANTAKLLAENPVLARMKELEALQEILKGAKTTFVFGSTNLTGQVQSLIDQPSVTHRADPGADN